MRTILRFAAFVGGMAAGFGVLLGIHRILPGIWLPLSLGGFLITLLATEPWAIENRWYFVPVAVALGSGIVSGWTQSNDGLRWRTVILTIGCLLTMAAMAEAFSVISGLELSRRRSRRILFVPVAMAWIVSDASSSHAGAGGMIDWVVAHLHLSLESAHTLVFWIRKSIHFIFYGSLGLSAAIASRSGRGAVAPSVWPGVPVWLRFGFLYSLFVATFDETRQSSQPGRTGSVYDVLLDAFGATVFLIALLVVVRGSEPKRTVSDALDES